MVLGLGSFARRSSEVYKLSRSVLEKSPTTSKATMMTRTAIKIAASMPYHIQPVTGVMRAM
jgi:hypothetical protein